MASVVCKLADDIEEKSDGTESIRRIYSERLAAHGVSFGFAKTACL